MVDSHVPVRQVVRLSTTDWEEIVHFIKMLGCFCEIVSSELKHQRGGEGSSHVFHFWKHGNVTPFSSTLRCQTKRGSPVVEAAPERSRQRNLSRCSWETGCVGGSGSRKCRSGRPCSPPLSLAARVAKEGRRGRAERTINIHLTQIGSPERLRRAAAATSG